MSTICRVPKCLFNAEIACSCGEINCKSHSREHCEDNPEVSHTITQLFNEINKSSREAIRKYLLELKHKVLSWGKIFCNQINTSGIEKPADYNIKSSNVLKTADYKLEPNYDKNRKTDCLSEFKRTLRNIDELILKIIATQKISKNICYSPITYYLARPIEETAKYLQIFEEVNNYVFDFKDFTNILKIINNKLYNFNYLNSENFFGAKICGFDELTLELENITYNFILDNELNNAKYICKLNKEILLKVVDGFDSYFIDFYIKLIENRISFIYTEDKIQSDLPELESANICNSYINQFIDFVCRVYVNGNNGDNAVNLLNKFVNLSQELFPEFTQEYEAYRYLYLGLISMHRSQNRDAKEFLLESAELYKTIQKPGLLANSYYSLGMLYAFWFKSKDAIIYGEMCKEICIEYNLPLLKSVYCKLGILHLYSGNTAKAEENLKEGSKLCDELDPEFKMAYLLLSIFKMNIKEAHQMADEIKREFDVYPSQNRTLGWLYALIGLIYFILGYKDNANSFLDMSGYTVKTSSEMYYQFNVGYSLVGIYAISSQIDKVEEIFNFMKEKINFDDLEGKFLIGILNCVIERSKGILSKESVHELKIPDTDDIKPRKQKNYARYKAMLLKDGSWEELKIEIFKALAMDMPENSIIKTISYGLIATHQKNIGNLKLSENYLNILKSEMNKFLSPKNIQVQQIKELKRIFN